MNCEEIKVPPHRKTPYVTVALTVEARTALQRATWMHSTPAGRRLTMSAVVLAALRVAEENQSRLIEILSDDHEEEEK